MGDKNKSGNFFQPKLEKMQWYKTINSEVKKIIDTNEKLASFLLDTSESNSDFSLEKVISANVGYSYILASLEIRSKLNNEIKIIEQILSTDNTGTQGLGILVFMFDEKVAYLGLENKKNLLGSIEEPMAIQMHFPNFSAGTTLALPAKIQKEVKGLLGKEPQVDRFIDLGQIKINPLHSPDQTSLFALVFDNVNPSEVKTKFLKLIKPEKLEEVIKKSRDPFLLSILSRLSSFDII